MRPTTQPGLRLAAGLASSAAHGHPGRTLAPAPGTHKQFGDLLQAWIRSGAGCPAA